MYTYMCTTYLQVYGVSVYEMVLNSHLAVCKPLHCFLSINPLPPSPSPLLPPLITSPPFPSFPSPVSPPLLSPSTAKDQVEISPPKQMQELTLQTMKNMLQKQRKAYETLSVNYCKSPSEKLGKDILDCESIIKLLESEIASKSPPIDVRDLLWPLYMYMYTRCMRYLPFLPYVIMDMGCMVGLLSTVQYTYMYI